MIGPCDFCKISRSSDALTKDRGWTACWRPRCMQLLDFQSGPKPGYDPPVLRDVSRLLPIARSSDPRTSHLAGEHVTATNRNRDCARLLKVIRANPGLIGAELRDFLDPPLGEGAMGDSVGKRMSDLVNRGLAYYEGEKRNSESGRLCGRIYAV